MGSQGALPQVDVEDRHDGVELRGENNLDPDLHWEMNYHEAAIFLEVSKTLFFCWNFGGRIYICLLIAGVWHKMTTKNLVFL